MPNLVGTSARFTVRLPTTHTIESTTIGGTAGVGDIMNGKTSSLTISPLSWTYEDSEVGGLTAQRVYMGIEPIEMTLVTPSYVISSGDGTMRMYFGRELHFAVTEPIKTNSTGYLDMGLRRMDIHAVLRSMDDGERTNNSLNPATYILDVLDIAEKYLVGAPKVAADGTVSKISSEIPVLFYDRDRSEMRVLSATSGTGTDVSGGWAAALGYS